MNGRVLDTVPPAVVVTVWSLGLTLQIPVGGIVTVTVLVYVFGELVQLIVYVWVMVVVVLVFAGTVTDVPLPDVALVPVQPVEVGVAEAVHDVTPLEVHESVTGPPEAIGMVYDVDPLTSRLTE